MQRRNDLFTRQGAVGESVPALHGPGSSQRDERYHSRVGSGITAWSEEIDSKVPRY